MLSQKFSVIDFKVLLCLFVLQNNDLKEVKLFVQLFFQLSCSKLPNKRADGNRSYLLHEK